VKFKKLALANTLGLLGAIYFVGCYAVTLVSPSLYKTIAESWMHMLNLSGLWKSAPEAFLLGIISFTATSWVTGWLFAWLYNKFVK